MGQLVKDRATNQVVNIPREEVFARRAAGEIEFFPGAVVTFETPDGSVFTVPPEEVDLIIARGNRPATGSQIAELQREAEFSGGGQQVLTGIEGALEGATLGLSPEIAKLFGASRFRQQQRQRFNPTTATISKIGGAVLPSLIPGGQFTAAGQVGKLGAAIGRAGESGGRIARIAAQAGAGVVEGAAFSAGLTFAEKRLQGESVEAAASNALSAGVGGAVVGGVISGGFGLVGEGIRKIAQKRIAATESAVAGAELSEALGALEPVIALGSVSGKAQSKADDAVRLLQAQVDDLRRTGGSADDLARAEAELATTRQLIKGEKGLAREIARDVKAQRAAFLKSVPAEKAAMQARAGADVVAKRLAADRVAGFGKLMIRRIESGVPVSSATVAAWEKFGAKLDEFDDLFSTGIKQAGKKARREVGYEAEEVGRIISADSARAARTISEMRDSASEVIAGLRRDGLLDPRVIEELGAAGVAVRSGGTEGAFEAAAGRLQGRAEAGIETLQGGGDDLLSLLELPPGGGGIPAIPKVQAAAEARAGKLAGSLASQKRLVKKLRGETRKLATKEGQLEAAQRRARDLREQSSNLASALAQKGEIEKVVTELTAKAEAAGVKFSKGDIATAALGLGLMADDPNADVMGLAELLLVLHGSSGVIGTVARRRGLGSRVASAAAGGIGREAGGILASKVSSGVGPIGRLIRGAGRGAGGRAGSEAARSALGRVGKNGLPQTAAEMRATFTARTARAMKRLGEFRTAGRKVAVATTSAILAKTRFHEMEHTGDSKLPKAERNFERRAAELDAVMGDPAILRFILQGRLERSGRVVDQDLLSPMVEAMAQTMGYLHSTLPPVRRLSPFDKPRRHASQAEINTFAARVRYASDIALVPEDLADGTLTVEGPETMREIAPMLYSQVRVQLVERAQKSELPYEARIFASTMFEIPLDVAATPELGLSLLAVHAGTEAQKQQRTARVLKSNTNKPTTVQRLEQ